MDALTETIRIRVTAADKARFEHFASNAGMSVSTWARVTLKASWRKETDAIFANIRPEIIAAPAPKKRKPK